MSTSQTSPSEAQQTPPDNDIDDIMESDPNSPPETHFTQNTQNPQQNQGSSRATTNTQSSNNGGGGDKLASGAPGASWTNKKFKEEYEGAVGRLIHQEYDPSRYGDPLHSWAE